MSNIHLLVLFVVPAYVIWRHYAAYKSKMQLAERVDAYLGDNANPEILKGIVFKMYQRSMRPFLAFDVMSTMLTTKRDITSTDGLSWKNVVESLEQCKKEEFYKILIGLVFVNVRLAPISHALVGICGVIKQMLKALREDKAAKCEPCKERCNEEPLDIRQKEFAGLIVSKLA
ncbi:hypothetical protein EDL57_17810 [Vibrio cholerae]|nr:hypothetical protein [Vibrio cholerae]